jgi:hypothetical protein
MTSLTQVHLDLVAEVLGIPADEGKYPITIENVSKDKRFALVHYDQLTVGTNPSPAVRNARGTIVDLETKTKVCSSFGYTPTAQLSGFDDPEDGLLRITDSDDVEHIIDITTATFQPLFEGTILRVWKERGVVHFSTHRRIDATNSNWGVSEKFVDLYFDYNGPEGNVLFDEEKEYAAHVHMFLIVDAALVMATKMPIKLDSRGNGGFLVYLGAIQQYTKEDSVFDAEKVQWESQAGKWFANPENFVTAKPELGKNPVVLNEEAFSTKVQIPATFNWEMTKQVLVKGYYPEFSSEEVPIHMLPGEAVLCTYRPTLEDGTLGPKQMLKLHSVSYQHRIDIVGNEPNMEFHAHRLLTESYFPRRDTDIDYYINRFPPLAVLTDAQMKEAVESTKKAPILFPLPTWKVPTEDELISRRSRDSRENRLRNALISYAFCLPPSLQSAGFDLYRRLVAARNSSISFICRNVIPIMSEKINASVPKYEDQWKRIRVIIIQAKKYAGERLARGEFVKGIKIPSVAAEHMTRDNIRNLLLKEDGLSLYRIARAIDNHINPPVVKLPTTVISPVSTASSSDSISAEFGGRACAGAGAL